MLLKAMLAAVYSSYWSIGIPLHGQAKNEGSSVTGHPKPAIGSNEKIAHLVRPVKSSFTWPSRNSLGLCNE